MNNKTMSFKNIIPFLLSLLFFQFSFAQNKLQEGMWKGTLQLNELDQLPFHFEIKKSKTNYFLEIINAEERIVVDEVTLRNDSLYFKMPVFDSEFRCKIINANQLQGVWINRARIDKNVIAFRASHQSLGCNPRVPDDKENHNASYWECEFSRGTKDFSKAKAIFKTTKLNIITGTFLTETGDYRFLSGEIYTIPEIVPGIKNPDSLNYKSFYLSCFDGSHAFLFKGELKGDSIINGQFFSGMHWYEPWVAVRNDKFELRNPDSLTYLKPGYNKIDFNFKNLEGKQISLSDEKYKNKVVIIQIMGSWCPNCMDETAFLSPLYEKNKKKGLEIIALAFEKTEDFTKAASNVSRLKKRYNANYEFLITEKTGKDKASEALPMLNGIMAFPTTIFIDKKGVVRKIYTGFTGPGTGVYYTRFTEQTNMFLEKLLRE